MNIDTNAIDGGQRLQRVGLAVRTEVGLEVVALADRMAAEMRRLAPKGARSTLANSIRADRIGPYEQFVGPNVDYAADVERGRRPGKGLPFFDTPQAQGAMAWLEGRIAETASAFNPKYRRGRKGSKRFDVEQLELRVRYFYWSQAVKRRGIPAHPFVAPTGAAFRSVAPDALAAAVRRGMALLGRPT